MISTSYLHQTSFKFVAFIGVLQKSPFETVLRYEIGGFHRDSVRYKSVLIHRIILNKQPGAFAFIVGELTAATTQLIRNISKLDDTDFMDVAWSLLNQAVLPKSLWGKMVATVAFLRSNRPPNWTISGDTPC